jgi:type I restriction enzyme S subunit
VKKLRFVGDCQNGISAGAEYFGTGFPFVSYGDVYNNQLLPKSVNGLAQSTEKEQQHYSIIEGDILFTRTSETIEEIGISSVCFETIKNAVFAGFLIRFRPYNNLLDKRFSKYFFRSIVPRTFFVKEMNLVTRASLSQELLKRLPILLPSMNEQEKISAFLDKKTNEIDAIVTKTQKEIDLLKEYKTALISEVVTGKVDVRDMI